MEEGKTNRRVQIFADNVTFNKAMGSVGALFRRYILPVGGVSWLFSNDINFNFSFSGVIIHESPV